MISIWKSRRLDCASFIDQGKLRDIGGAALWASATLSVPGAQRQLEEASPGTFLLGTQTTQKALQWPRRGCQPWAEVSAGERQVLPFLSAITRELVFLVQERICGQPHHRYVLNAQKTHLHVVG